MSSKKLSAHTPMSLTLFATQVFRDKIGEKLASKLNAELAQMIDEYAQADEAGKAYCRAHHYPGYTSYGSLTDLPQRAPCFAELQRELDVRVRGFSKELAFDLQRGRLVLDNMWVNSLDPQGFHSGHIHPHSVISGTYYVRANADAAQIKFEDPRLSAMMVAPPRRTDAPQSLQPFIYLSPQPGEILLWESWLRHEVCRHEGREPRLSVSFNYRWK